MATIENSSNASNVSIVDAQYTKSFKVITAILTIEFDVDSVAPFRIDVGIPIVADSSQILTGAGAMESFNGVDVLVYPLDDATFTIHCTAPTSAPTGAVLIVTITYKSAA